MVSSHTVGHGPGPTGAAEKAAGLVLKVTEAIKFSYMLLTCLLVLLSRNMIRIVLYKNGITGHVVGLGQTLVVELHILTARTVQVLILILLSQYTRSSQNMMTAAECGHLAGTIN